MPPVHTGPEIAATLRLVHRQSVDYWSSFSTPSAGPFAPAPVKIATGAERDRIMGYHAEAVEQLARSIGRWSEAALDARRLEHPLLGPITGREMLFFTLYHNRHHLEGVQRRVGNSNT